MTSLTWLITGASRGFGRELTRQALRRGDRVVATARDPRALERAHPGHDDRLLAAALDVTDEARARAVAEEAVERFGAIDVLVNNAGRGLVGAVEEASADEVRALFETNVFGLLAVCRAVVPVMRRQRSGRILNLSSMAGVSVAPGWGVYAASKHAVEAISEGLDAELRPLGIRSTAVEPGAFRTDFLDASSLHRIAAQIDDYAATADVGRTWATDTNHAQLGDPAKAAAAMIRIATAPDPPIRIQLGADAVARIEGREATVRAELDRWRELSLSTALES